MTKYKPAKFNHYFWQDVISYAGGIISALFLALLIFYSFDGL